MRSTVLLLIKQNSGTREIPWADIKQRFVNGIDPKNPPNWTLHEWASYVGLAKQLDSVSGLHQPVFPEIPWKGDHVMMQVAIS